MKSQHTLTAALAAFAGLSFAVAYAAPSYTPNASSPINTTPLLDSQSQNLDNFDDYVGAIQAKLPVGMSLILPTPALKTFPIFKDFNTAVAAAVAADPAHTVQIVGAASQFQAGNYAGKVKDIVKLIATNSPAYAEDAVIGAIAANPIKAADAASGAILGIIASTAAGTADYGDIADEAIEPSTRLLIEKVAKAAVAATKKAPVTSPINAVKVATAITDAVLADGSGLYIDDLARGLVAGAAGINASSQADVAAAALARLNGGAFENTRYVSEFVSGALKAVVVVGTGPGTPSTAYTNVLAALKTETSVGVGFASAIDAISAAHLALRNAPSGGEAAALSAALDATNALQIEAFSIGAFQNKSAKAADLLTAVFVDPQTGALSNATKQAIVGAAVRSKFSGAAKVTAAAINATTNGLSRSLTVAAAIPNATFDYAGVITGAAVKLAGGTSNTATVGDDQPDDVASAALSAAVSAGYQGAINDIALQAVKAKKLQATAIVQTLVANADSAGWREAIVAAAVINDKANKVAIKASADAGAVAAGSSAFERASLALTGELAFAAKSSSKTAFDDAVGDFYGAPVTVGLGTQPASNFTKAILFGRGGVNIKNAGALLAIGLKFDTNASVSDSDILSIAKSIYKKNSAVLDIQYAVAKDALANPDQLFDLVDHATFTNLAKYSPDIATAAVAARPEYAHYIARAASFRSPANAGKIGAAAITFGHMKANRNTAGALIADPNDPAAVAAISAGTILGVLDAKLIAAKETAAVKAAAAALVKAALLLSDDTATFRQSDGLTPSSFTLIKATGSAGAVTGLISQLDGYGGSTTTDLPAGSLAETALIAAAKADKKNGVIIAQAAAQAFQYVFQLSGGIGEISAAFKAKIVAAVTTGGGTGGLANAVEFGVDEAVSLTVGAGAAGILNYSHHSGTGSPVTDISNF